MVAVRRSYGVSDLPEPDLGGRGSRRSRPSIKLTRPIAPPCHVQFLVMTPNRVSLIDRSCGAPKLAIMMIDGSPQKHSGGARDIFHTRIPAKSHCNPSLTHPARD